MGSQFCPHTYRLHPMDMLLCNLDTDTLGPSYSFGVHISSLHFLSLSTANDTRFIAHFFCLQPSLQERDACPFSYVLIVSILQDSETSY